MPDGKVPLDFEIGGDGDEAVSELKKIVGLLEQSKKATEEQANEAGFLEKIMGSILKTALALASIDFFVDFGRRLIEISQAAKELEITGERAQALAIAGEKVGLSMGQISDVMKNLAREQGQRNNLFQVLGISMNELARMTPDQLFQRLSLRISEGRLNVVEMTTAIALMGGQGTAAFKAMSNGFEEFRKEAIENGQIVAEESFGAITESVKELGLAIEQLADNAVAGLTDEFSTFADFASNKVEQLVDSIDVLQASFVFLRDLGGGLLAGFGFSEASDRAVNNARDFLGEVERERGQRRERRGPGAVSDIDIAAAEGQASRLTSLGHAARTRVGASGGLSNIGVFTTRGQSDASRMQSRMISRLDLLIKQTKSVEDAVNKNG